MTGEEMVALILAGVAEDERAAFCRIGHDPTRVLRECAAKRAIVDLHKNAGPSRSGLGQHYGEIEAACWECGTAGEYGVKWPCDTLRALASVYTPDGGVM